MTNYAGGLKSSPSESSSSNSIGYLKFGFEISFGLPISAFGKGVLKLGGGMGEGALIADPS